LLARAAQKGFGETTALTEPRPSGSGLHVWSDHL